MEEKLIFIDETESIQSDKEEQVEVKEEIKEETIRHHP